MCSIIKHPIVSTFSNILLPLSETLKLTDPDVMAQSFATEKPGWNISIQFNSIQYFISDSTLFYIKWSIVGT